MHKNKLRNYAIITAILIGLFLFIILLVEAAETWDCGQQYCTDANYNAESNLTSWGNWSCDTGAVGNATINGTVITINDMDASNPRGCTYAMANYTDYLNLHMRFGVEHNINTSQDGRIELRHSGNPPNTWITSVCPGKGQWTECYIEALIPANATQVRLKVGGTSSGEEKNIQWRNVTFQELPVENISCPNASLKLAAGQEFGMPDPNNYSIYTAIARSSDSWLWGALNMGVFEIEHNFEPLTFQMVFSNNNITAYSEDMNVPLEAIVETAGGIRRKYILDTGVGDNCVPIAIQLPAGGNSLPSDKAILGVGTNGSGCTYGTHDSVVMNIPSLGGGNITIKSCPGTELSFLINKSDSYIINYWSLDTFTMHATLNGTKTLDFTGNKGQLNISH